jgi:hypothetical protein
VTFEWQVPLIVLGIVVGIFFFAGRPKGDADADAGADKDPGGGSPPDSAPGLESLSGPELVDRIQQTLGIGILVDSFESAEVITLRATFLYGQHTTETTVTGESETEAWQQLAKAAVAWRNLDYQHLPMWWGGAG